MRDTLFYSALISFAVGILLQTWFAFSIPTITWFALIGFVMAVLWRRQGAVSSSFPVLLVSVACLCFALGTLRLLVAETALSVSPYHAKIGEMIEVEGVVTREPDQRERSTQLFVQTTDELLLVRGDRYVAVNYGDRVRVEGRLDAPEPFETDLGRTFNYPGYLKAQGVTHSVVFADVDVLAEGEGNVLLQGLLSFKHRFMTHIEHVVPEPHVGLAEGLLLGVKTGLGENLEQAFRSTGIIHIVVLSGYNVMIVIAFVLYGLAFVLPFRGRLIVGLFAITGFALLVGLSATVVRASVMAGLLLLAQLFGRTHSVLRGLALAGAAMLVINPYLIAYDVGFQLSFVATLGLILLAPWLEVRLARVPNNFLKTREFITATVATQIFVTPLLLYQIGEFSVVSVLVNVIVLPMVPVAMLLTFLTGLAAFVSSSLAALIAFPTYLSLAYIVLLAEGFAALPFASYIVPAFPFWVVPLSYAILGYLIWRVYDPEVANRYGDLAERWFVADTAREQVSDMEGGTQTASGWVIEEESVVQARLASQLQSAQTATAAGARAPAAVADDTPVFFR